MADDPSFPPPDHPRPFDWVRDAPEWGEDGWDPDTAGCIFVLASIVCLIAGFIILYAALPR